MAAVETSTTSSSVLAALNSNSSSSKSTTSAEDIQNRFLTLLVAQLENQDPLNPMDNAEMTSQMAQMSTVSGIEKLNTTLNSLVDSIGTSQSMQAASMIGKPVRPSCQAASSCGAWRHGTASVSRRKARWRETRG